MTTGGGAIVNLSSRAYLGNIGQANYSASKAGVVGLTRTLALELARHNIRVNAIAPGFVDTEMARAVPADVRERVVKTIPLRRMARPEEIANVALFLASESRAISPGRCWWSAAGAAWAAGWRDPLYFVGWALEGRAAALPSSSRTKRTVRGNSLEAIEYIDNIDIT